jgi:D-3-phosphoglycerate dehydrogenase/(S)-sulfolactate dehydrogenase
MSVDILLSEQIGGPPVDPLSESHTVALRSELWREPTALRAALSGCRALIVRNQTRVTADVIAAGDRLQVIGRAGAGLENIDVGTASSAGVVVVSTPDQNSLSVAELAVGLMFALARQIPAADRDTRAGTRAALRPVLVFSDADLDRAIDAR